MRKAWLLLLLAPSALVWACGGDDTSDGGTDAQSDNTTKPDTGGDGAADAKSDGTSTLDSSNDVVTNPDQFSVTCRQPSDCVDGGMPDVAYPPSEAGVVCCGDLVLSGQIPNCNFDSFATKCQAPGSCASNIQLTCGTDIVRGCAHNSECAENGYNKCCTVQGFGDASVCMSQGLATTIGASCLP